uniref:Uncharacterized protein n=1 Tax=Bracon brevicornis TaxID=1563983 RepID=A0A6V7LRT2_9HYME
MILTCSLMFNEDVFALANKRIRDATHITCPNALKEISLSRQSHPSEGRGEKKYLKKNKNKVEEEEEEEGKREKNNQRRDARVASLGLYRHEVDGEEGQLAGTRYT